MSPWHDDEPGCTCDDEWSLPPSAPAPDPADVEKAAPHDELREQLGRWLFERDYGGATTLCSPQDAGWHEWVERNREEWREEADALLAALAAAHPSPDSEAVARVRDLADQLDEDADAADQLARGWLDVGSHADRDRCLALADDRRENAARIRAALGTGDREGQ